VNTLGELASSWEPAPTVLVGAGIALALFGRSFVRLRARGRSDHAGWSRLVLFAAATTLGTLALVSPLDEIGDSYLLSGHMLQHVLIGDAAPALALVALRGPLLVFTVPTLVLRLLARARPLRRALAFLLRPSVALVTWCTVVGAWHVPAAYDYALEHETVHDLEHVSFMLVGLLVWTQIVDPARSRRLAKTERVGYMLALVAAGAALAGVLAFASTPLYPAYASDPRLLGLSPLRDQQLAGLVMLAEQLLATGACAWFLVRGRLGAPAASRRRLVPARRPA
jgi:cytochrome c oxidase assembly factor CtaG